MRFLLIRSGLVGSVAGLAYLGFLGNCSDLWGSTGHQASYRGAAKHGICFASRLVPSNVNSYVSGWQVAHRAALP